MTSKINQYQVWVLCEDWSHYHFIRSLLTKLGINPKRINPAAPFPEGKGSAEQFVREHFSVALRKYARHQEKRFLTVIVDVDQDREPAKMLDVLEKVSLDDSLEGIKDSDKLFLAFPKKNIETWFEWLSQDNKGKSQVNEIQDYKYKWKNAPPRRKFGKDAAELYIQWKNSPDNFDRMLPSMQYTYNNLKKLDELLTSME